MARTLLVAGTASHVGKSTVAAGLCRLLARRGVDVAPFKAQNMSNNARVALQVGDEAGSAADASAAAGSAAGPWGEIGVSQWVQARAAGLVPTTDHNPVLLKPRGAGESQVVIQGAAVGHAGAGDYDGDLWARARAAAEASYRRLAADHDVIVAEGAGSIAEINLRDRDLANVETARFTERVASETRREGRAARPRGTEILLLADVERGGAFASLYGTLELLPGDLRERVAGAVITKFRGDESLLASGIEEIEARTGVPVVGVLPYDDPGLPAEDGVGLPAAGTRAVRGVDDGVPADRAVTVAVPRLPRISNVTDLEPLARAPGVRVAYVPPSDDLGDADAVVLPGTKNTVDDLLALRDAGFGDALGGFDGPVVGLCGGYQLLGERITNAAVESADPRFADDSSGGGAHGGAGVADEVDAFGLLAVETRFARDKRVARVERELHGVGPLAGARGTVSGYEIHAGETRHLADLSRPLGGASAATDRLLGTYLHGLFENRVAREAFLDAVFAHAGRARPAGRTGQREADARGGSGGDPDGGAAARSGVEPSDRAAALVAAHVDLEALGLAPASTGGAASG